MVLLILTIVAVLCSLLFLKYKKTYSFWSSRGVSGPAPIPFFGTSFSTCFLKPWAEVDLDNHRKYGDIYGTYEGAVPTLIVSDPKIIEKIFITNFSDFQQNIFTHSDDPIDKNSLLFLSGENWKRVRTSLSLIFTTSKLRSVALMMPAGLKKLNQVLDKLAENNEDMLAEHIYKVAFLDNVTRSFYSLEIDAYDSRNKRFVDSASGILGGLIAFRMILLQNLPGWLLGILGISLGDRDRTTYFNNMVKEVLAGRTEEDRTRRTDLVQLMIEGRSKNTEDASRGLSDEELLANAILFFAAGFDTSKNTATMFTYRMALHPEIQEKVYQEVKEKLGDKTAEQLTYDDYMQLRYMEHVIMETLRHHSVDVRGFRTVTSDTTIPLTDIHVPKGTQVNVPYYVLHLDERNFDNPLEFDPDRFADKDNIKPCTWMPFGGGPRFCIGQRFAYLSLKVILSNVVRRYRIEKAESTPDVYRNPIGYFMLEPVALRVKLIKRDD